MCQNLMILARLGDLRTRSDLAVPSSAGPPLLQRSLSAPPPGVEEGREIERNSQDQRHIRAGRSYGRLVKFGKLL
jgi:hypothetical protein